MVWRTNLSLFPLNGKNFVVNNGVGRGRNFSDMVFHTAFNVSTSDFVWRFHNKKHTHITSAVISIYYYIMIVKCSGNICVFNCNKSTFLNICIHNLFHKFVMFTL